MSEPTGPTPDCCAGGSHPPSASQGSPACCSAVWFLSAGAVALLYALDQATKLWTAGLDVPWLPKIEQHLPLGGHFAVIPNYFDWVHFSNTGAAFGILQDSNKFFIGLSIAAVCGLGWALKKSIFPGRLNFVALLLLLSGVLGNFTDRVVHGYVVDFLFFDLGFAPFNPWPAFNVADSCICVAVALLLTASFLEAKDARAVARREKGG